MNIPLYLTAARILAIPLLVLAYYYLPVFGHHLAALLFAAAAITDFFDGYLARKNAQETRLGAFLDPVADKLLVVVAIILVVAERHWMGLVLPAIVIIGREIAISALREWMSTIGDSLSVAVSWLGKIKTCLQMIALGFLLWFKPGDSAWFLGTGVVMLYAASVLTIWSMIIYLRAAKKSLTF